MRIHFLGAAQEVTGSMFVLDTPQGSLLVDCGMFQGHRQEARERNREIPARAVQADAAVLTHAHIDHSGNLPTLVKRGFKGAVYATAATRDVAALMLQDSAKIQEADAEYLNNRMKGERDFVPIEPLYDEEDVVRVLARFVGLPYKHVFSPLPGVRARFLEAGHILGSSQLELEVEDGDQVRRLLFSGDLGRAGLPILRDPELPVGPFEAVVMESTYGNRVHGDTALMAAELERVVKQAVARGGKVVIPAFALGRTQEIVLVLHELFLAGRLPPVPVFIDSPLATRVTGVYTLHPECFDTHARQVLEKVDGLFAFAGLHYVATREESMALNERPGPAIIISAAGMAEAGRVLHHLRHTVEDKRNTIVIVGFMAEHTLGRKLAERHQRVRILGVERELNATVEVLDSFSAHADREGLMRWALACGKRSGRFLLVHGEPDQQAALRGTMEARGLTVQIPRRWETVDLG